MLLRCRARALVAIVVLGTGALVPHPAAAQASPEQVPRTAPPTSPPDFLLGRPKGAIALRGGWLFANTGSDIYEFVTDQLTIEKTSFNTPVFGGELAVTLSNRLDLVVGIERGKSSTSSEYRDLVDNQLLPIAQTTERDEYSVSASVKVALVPKGQRISRFAWIPRTLTPYVGAGAGALRYRFTQHGSFVDADTSRVFDSTFNAQGWTPSVHAMAGADLRLYRKLYLTTEGRYTWSAGDLGDDFVDFDPIDLAGFRVGAGLQILF